MLNQKFIDFVRSILIEELYFSDQTCFGQSYRIVPYSTPTRSGFPRRIHSCCPCPRWLRYGDRRLGSRAVSASSFIRNIHGNRSLGGSCRFLNRIARVIRRGIAEVGNREAQGQGNSHGAQPGQVVGCGIRPATPVV